MSAKWTKRTEGAVIQWPAGGTFDVETCEQMRALVLYHKQNDKGKHRTEKRVRELHLSGRTKKKVRVRKIVGTQKSGDGRRGLSQCPHEKPSPICSN